jgi:hypothetical protein
MRMYRAYCSACDRPVRVIPISEFPEDARPENVSETAVVCLDYGEECTGSLCPLFETPTSEMRQLVEQMQGSTDS